MRFMHRLSHSVRRCLAGTGTAAVVLSSFLSPALWPVPAHAQSADIVVDDSDPEAQAVSGNWWAATTGTGYGQGFVTTFGDVGEFRWSPPLSDSVADYDVYVMYASNWRHAGDDAHYNVAHENGTAGVTVDQTKNGGQWVPLGRYTMRQGSYVSLGGSMSGEARPSADAVRLVRVGVPATPPDGLNVLLITIDDLRPELGAYGTSIHTPNIDALAQQGTTFTRAFAQMSTCSPSRTSMLTGLRPDTAGVTDQRTHFRDTVPTVVTLPQYFKNHGYRTEGFCKVYHNGLDDPQSWSVPHKNASGPNVPSGPDGKTLPFAAVDAPLQQFADYKCANLAIEAIDASTTRNAPFFIAVGFKKPHLPFVAPKAYFDLYDPNAIPLAPNRFKALDAPAVAFEDRGELRTYSGIPPASEPMSMALMRDLKHGYYAATTFVDAQVGRVLAALEVNGLGSNTIVVLLGDHGFHLGEQDDWAKHTNFDVGTQTPLIIRVPGATGDRSSAALAELVDLYPTIIELAGLPLPSNSARGGYPMEGDSLLNIIESPAAASRRGAFSQWRRDGYDGYSIRTDRFRFTEWRKGENLLMELYDHDTDPNETANVAYHAEYASVVNALQAALSAGGNADLPASLQ